MNIKERASRNRTLTCSASEIELFSSELLTLSANVSMNDIGNKIINQDFETAIDKLPIGFVDLLILDPPYNLTKNYNGRIFKNKDRDEYSCWFENVIDKILPKLKNDATVYVCSDWKTSAIIYPILEKYFIVRNRITWEREKGRGALSNWKNNTEDIWFCTIGDDYYFDVEKVKLKKKVIAPYRDKEGKPKDWLASEGGNFRLTYPSNFWSDITIPFWSMPENTDHPTQKPEKLIAKLLLASSEPNDFVFDPFMGSGTTAVVATKLGRMFCGIEIDTDFCCWGVKRLKMIEENSTIQGYSNGVFWDRNSLAESKTETSVTSAANYEVLF